MILQETTLASPDQLLVATDPDLAGGLDRFWPPGEPTDGSVRVNVQDAATVDGIALLLYEVVTGPCTGVDDCAGELRVVDVAGATAPRTVYTHPKGAWEYSASAQIGPGLDGMVVGSYPYGSSVDPIVVPLADGWQTTPSAFGLQESHFQTNLTLAMSPEGYFGRATAGLNGPGDLAIFDLVGDNDWQVPLADLPGAPIDLQLLLERDRPGLRVGRALFTVALATGRDVVALDLQTGELTTVAEDVNSVTVGTR